VDLFDVIRSCFRRWYVVLPLLLATAWFVHHTYTAVKPVYYSSAVVGIAPPNSTVQYGEPGAAVPRNGLLETGGAMLIMNMAVLGFDDPSVRAQVVAGGGKADFVVKMFPSPASGAGPQEQLPLIMIEATEDDPNSAARTIELAAAQADPVMRNLQQQAGVPDALMAHALSASPPSAPIAAAPSRTRSALYLSALGAAIAILVGVVVDVLLMRRKMRLQVQRQTGNDTDAAKGAKNGPPQNENVTADMAMDSR
jgi:hypothetical protein